MRVNGLAPPSGLVVLQDRDDIRLPGQVESIFFSAERQPMIEPFADTATAGAVCPRCPQRLADGTPAVRCAGCEVAFHQSAELPCFTYAEHCPVCGAATALDAGFRWSPEDL